MSNETFKPQLDSSAYLKVGNTGLKNWQAVNEIIANSIDSWISGGTKKDLIVRIDLNNKQNNLEESSIRIVDNALGMEKEELKNLFSFFKSEKSKSKYAEKFLGLYGFGFKAATSKLGTRVSVITSKSTSELHKITVDYQELLSSKNFELKIETSTHTSASKKMFNGSSTGTVVEVSSFNQNFSPTVLYDWLPVSWKQFINGEMYDKKLKIYIGKNIEKSNLLPAHNLKIVDDSKVDLNVSFEWLDSQKVKQKGKVAGYFGIRTKKDPTYGLNTQGLNVYRRGQLIERYNYSYYKDGAARHNYQNALVGEINVEINVNTVKNAVEDSDAHEAMSAALNKEFKKYIPSFTQISAAVATNDQDIINKEIANFKKKNGFKLSSAQKKLLSATGSIEEVNNKSSSMPSPENAPAPKKATRKISFELIDWNKYKIDKREYVIEFTPYSSHSDSPYVLVPVSENVLNIYIFTLHQNGKEIEKALKNRDKNAQSKIICLFLVCEAVEKHLKILQFSKKDIQQIKEIILGS